jgi:ABC-type multidrug transport system fused ATPase/permease subunit
MTDVPTPFAMEKVVRVGGKSSRQAEKAASSEISDERKIVEVCRLLWLNDRSNLCKSMALLLCTSLVKQYAHCRLIMSCASAFADLLRGKKFSNFVPSRWLSILWLLLLRSSSHAATKYAHVHARSGMYRALVLQLCATLYSKRNVCHHTGLLHSSRGGETSGKLQTLLDDADSLSSFLADSSLTVCGSVVAFALSVYRATAVSIFAAAAAAAAAKISAKIRAKSVKSSQSLIAKCDEHRSIIYRSIDRSYVRHRDDIAMCSDASDFEILMADRSLKICQTNSLSLARMFIVSDIVGEFSNAAIVHPLVPFVAAATINMHSQSYSTFIEIYSSMSAAIDSMHAVAQFLQFRIFDEFDGKNGKSEFSGNVHFACKPLHVSSLSCHRLHFVLVNAPYKYLELPLIEYSTAVGPCETIVRKRREKNGGKGAVLWSEPYVVNMDRICLSSVTLMSPSQDVLFSGLSMAINRSDVVLVRGDKSSGKTAFFKLLMGVWPPQLGEFARPPPSSSQVFYLWAKPYLPLEATMTDQVAYPQHLEVDGEAEKIVGECLMIAGLSYLTDGKKISNRPMGKDEQQQLCVARLFYNNPKFCFIDGGLDDCNLKFRTSVIEKLKADGCGLIVASNCEDLSEEFEFSQNIDMMVKITDGGKP